MLDVDRLYLDTNVFIAMGEGADDVSDALFGLASSQVSGSGFLCTSELALAELLVKPLRDGYEQLARLYEDWIASADWLAVQPVDRSVLRLAAAVRARYPSIKLPDAIHLSTAIGLGCSHCLTGDERLPREVTFDQSIGAAAEVPSVLRMIFLNPANVSLVRHKGSS